MYLATLLVWYVLFVEVVIEHGCSFDTELCLEGARLVVDAHVDHTTVVTSLMSSCNQYHTCKMHVTLNSVLKDQISRPVFQLLKIGNQDSIEYKFCRT